MDNSLAKQEARSIAKPPETALSVGQMMQKVIDSNITTHGAAVLEQLVKLQGIIDARQAEKDFTQAYVLMQAEIPKVQATKPVNAKDGSLKYMIATLEDIDGQARPIMQKFGFCASFSEGPFVAGKITKVCHLSHVGGHTRSNSYSVRIGNGPPGATESQADGSAHSYAKRGAFCDALNIVIGHLEENDVKNEGGPITLEQAGQIYDRLKALPLPQFKGKVIPFEVVTNKFLEWAGAEAFDKISSSNLPMILGYLKEQEASAKVPW